MARRPSYPFEPRSNAYVEPGQFWGVPLSDGRFACGRVLAIPGGDDALATTGSTKEFAAGLLNWVGDALPTSDSIAGSPVLISAIAHVLLIRENGQFILGSRPLEADGIGNEIAVTHRSGGTPYVYRNFERVRPASREEIATLPMVHHWGYKVISRIAEHVFVHGGELPPASSYGYA